MNIFKNTISGFISLIKGLQITISNAFKKPFTIMYPYEKDDLPKISRQCLQMNYKDGVSKCVACRICEKICPQKAIEITTCHSSAGGNPSSPNLNKTILKEYKFDPEKCMYCGLCTEKCPFDAISWNQNFNMASSKKGQKIIYKKNLTSN
jgi:formate hydrogenlyase subunit 6/NADH:ubiquinone oxidoreductase subunit I